MWLPSASVCVLSVTTSAEYGALLTTRPGLPASAPRKRACGPPGPCASSKPRRPGPRPGPGPCAKALKDNVSRATIVIRIGNFLLNFRNLTLGSAPLIQKTDGARHAIGAEHDVCLDHFASPVGTHFQTGRQHCGARHLDMHHVQFFTGRSIIGRIFVYFDRARIG